MTAARTSNRRKLTANHRLIFDTLSEARRPLTAYEIIDKLRPNGISAPPTVYRALTRLIDERLAHRLESLNAFVACTHPHAQHASVVFAICNECRSVTELLDADVSSKLARKAAERNFAVDSTIVELRGICGGCSAAKAESRRAAGAHS